MVIRKLLVSFFITTIVEAKLKVLEIKVPKFATAGDKITLECTFDLDDDNLFSVKWYKDENEFFRYLNRQPPIIHVFQLAGVKVLENVSNRNVIVLDQLELSSSGVYRCEVNGDVPTFSTDMKESQMNVVSQDSNAKTNALLSRLAIGLGVFVVLCLVTVSIVAIKT